MWRLWLGAIYIVCVIGTPAHLKPELQQDQTRKFEETEINQIIEESNRLCDGKMLDTKQTEEIMMKVFKTKLGDKNRKTMTNIANGASCPDNRDPNDAIMPARQTRTKRERTIKVVDTVKVCKKKDPAGNRAADRAAAKDSTRNQQSHESLSHDPNTINTI